MACLHGMQLSHSGAVLDADIKLHSLIRSDYTSIPKHLCPQVDTFLLKKQKPLGELKKIKIGHDNHGMGPGLFPFRKCITVLTLDLPCTPDLLNASPDCFMLHIAPTPLHEYACWQCCNPYYNGWNYAHCRQI